MIIDTSVLIAILKDESDAHALSIRIVDCADARVMSAASYLEAGIVADSQRNDIANDDLDELIAALGIEIVAVTPAQAILARQAHRAYGRGSGHPAKLNFGDCFSYALATDRREALLFKGDDFSHTDVLRA